MRSLRWAWPLALVAMLACARAEAPLWSTEAGRARVFDAVVDLFRDRYWDPGAVDWAAWASSYRPAVLAADDRRAFDAALSRMVDAVGDGHSRWLGLSSFQPDEGLAAPATPALGVETAYLRAAGLVVTRVLPSSPAADAGLRRGDVLERVGDDDLRDRSGWDAGGLLRRAVASGTDVRLGVRRGRQHFEARLTPAPLDQAGLAAEPAARMLDPVTGYLVLPSFTRDDTGSRVHALLRTLLDQGARRLVLDMRGNLGGRVTELGLVLGAFEEGPFARAVARGTQAWVGRYAVQDGVGVARLEAPDGSLVGAARVDAPVRFDGPLVILVDGTNASAGEVGPLLLQQAGRARVVGERTAGNVEAVQGFDLPDGSVVVLAVANLQGPDGASLDAGVRPDRRADDTLAGLARGYDASLATALALLGDLPFTPGALF